MNRGMVLLTACLALSGACSDPYGGRPCILDGFVRDPGPACTLPRLGTEADSAPGAWQSKMGVDLGSLTAAMHEGDIVLFIKTYGAPVTDGTVVYGVAFRFEDMMADDPKNSNVAVLVTKDLVWVQYNGIDVDDLPIRTAFAATGIEVRIPINLLPYDGQAIINDLQFDWIDGQWRASGLPWGSTICWDPSNPDNGCASPL